MSHKDKHSTTSSSTLESGRVHVCGGLFVSVNRSWQVAAERGRRPAAPFKGMAPLALWSSTDTAGDRGHVYLAAVAAHDAFWLGFEADEGLCFAVIINLNGRCALTGRHGRSDVLEHEPPNFLVIPDQPWFDCIVGAESTFEQLIPRFDPEVDPTGFASGGEIHLVIYPVDVNSQQASLVPQPEGPFPLYLPENAAARTEQAVHPWRGRALRKDFHPTHSCARLTFHIVEPKRFEVLTGVQLSPGMFDDACATPPPPYNPFRGP